jgi:hypothetical protein
MKNEMRASLTDTEILYSPRQKDKMSECRAGEIILTRETEVLRGKKDR